MKVLVSYDGSNCSDAAVADLARSGLPTVGLALVISVAEGWLAPEDAGTVLDPDGPELAACTTLAKHAKSQIQKALPGWQVDADGAFGSPAREILARAQEFDADLVVAGAQGTSAMGRSALGPIALRLLASAPCSVRVARDRAEMEDKTAVRIVIALDGSPGSFAAVDRVASGLWPQGSEVRIISAAGHYAPPGVGRFVEPGRIAGEADPSERIWLEGQAEEALRRLRKLDLPVSSHVLAGNARIVVAEEAARWAADCIFLGAGGGFGPRLGSTAAAVAARAASSVEIVRPRDLASTE